MVRHSFPEPWLKPHLGEIRFQPKPIRLRKKRKTNILFLEYFRKTTIQENGKGKNQHLII